MTAQTNNAAYWLDVANIAEQVQDAAGKLWDKASTDNHKARGIAKFDKEAAQC